jgi:hypothetical protein
MTKRALVVGINDYSNWNTGVTVNGVTLSAPNLHYCDADAGSFAQLLQDGFSFDTVTLLQDSQATCQAILDNVQGLISASEAGDVVCFYFSGHGGRIPERPSDATTRYYETIITYDAAMISSAQIASIATALPPSKVNFTLVLDSCHSGGMFLSPDARGAISDGATAQTFQAQCSAIVPWVCLPDPSPMDGNVSGLTLQESGICSMTIDPSKDAAENAKATLLSACDYSELSAESPSLGHGYFTQSILEVVNSCNFEITHTDLLAALRTRIAGYQGSHQTPELRGRPVRLAESFLTGWNYSI